MWIPCGAEQIGVKIWEALAAHGIDVSQIDFDYRAPTWNDDMYEAIRNGIDLGGFTVQIHGAWTTPKPAAPSTDDDAPNEEAQRTQDQYLLNNPRRIRCRVCGGVHPYATRQCTAVPIRKDDLPVAQQYVPGSGKAPISDGEGEYLREQLRGKGESEFTRGESRQWRFDQHGQDPAELRGPFSLLRVDATRRNEQFERELVEMCDDVLVALTLDYDEELRCYWVDLKRGSGDTHPIWRWAWDQERVLVDGWPWGHRK